MLTVHEKYTSRESEGCHRATSGSKCFFFNSGIFMETAESLTPISLRPKLRDSAGRGRGRGRGRNFNEGSGQVVDSYT